MIVFHRFHFGTKLFDFRSFFFCCIDNIFSTHLFLAYCPIFHLFSLTGHLETAVQDSSQALLVHVSFWGCSSFVGSCWSCQRINHFAIVHRAFKGPRLHPWWQTSPTHLSDDFLWSFFIHMFEPCLSHVWATFEPRLSHAWAMLEPCLRHAWAMLELYLSYTWAMLEPCLSHAWAMFEPCLSHVWAMPERCLSHCTHNWILFQMLF